MTKMTYREQLLHPNWQRKRLEILNDAGFTCEVCGDTETTLNVHHKRYVKGRKVWEYERRELTCLCEVCHRTEHEAREELDQLLMVDDGIPTRRLAALLAGILEGNLGLDSLPSIPPEFELDFEMGLLVSMLSSQMPDGLLRAAQGAGVVSLTPPQQAAVDRWSRFSDALEKSGL